MKKVLIAGLILVLSMMVLTGCQGEVKAEEPLKIGMELKYPPFETKDADGNPAGASVMLANALGEYLGRDIEIIDTPYTSLIPALEQGNIDLIISSMTITPSREEVVDFSEPYTTSQLMMLVYKDSKVQSAADLNDPDVIIASKTGTIGAIWAEGNAPEAQIKNIDEEASAVLEVAQGKADVFIYDPLSIIRHHENYADTTRAVLEPLPNTKGWGIAMRKGEEALKEQVNAFIEKAKTDGTYDNIRETYLQDKIKEFEDYGLDFFF
ncbi:transporter substrate-binding domain-containing protein [Fusibacter paucivorans]|uniref:Transporter substrate-binding domain-containing protein n=1 Tax=Fusibacter paucivorans TaxID=76009 RepID=A0ABS5PR48_9FIRM|nr:transporter substrate-binding domain-containing protein [Fusibacter paucivorans]MBS7527615.1 transporter substrate-binding domain-containing protein [Fusibacter paucivorans]